MSKKAAVMAAGADGTYHASVNPATVFTFSGATCPYGPHTFTAALSPELNIDGINQVLSATLSSGSGVWWNSVLSSYTIAGTLTASPGAYVF